ncbi:hypothetical protein THAOC_20225 [Thalassiosira oceanica]|uniref:Uncharacterized protein n=1 Tax=Thalassiosira oceanica TaxID=159749 RepID=K0S0B4_THAOC|nr:hypothetical protein THAOC_20225 [Thalassiosira oceanica]|eukprot:EJK59533.1 hypothetical protein THAOC_20225 [Thalassiosira oceanica]
MKYDEDTARDDQDQDSSDVVRKHSIRDFVFKDWSQSGSATPSPQRARLAGEHSDTTFPRSRAFRPYQIPSRPTAPTVGSMSIPRSVSPSVGFRRCNRLSTGGHHTADVHASQRPQALTHLALTSEVVGGRRSDRGQRKLSTVVRGNAVGSPAHSAAAQASKRKRDGEACERTGDVGSVGKCDGSRSDIDRLPVRKPVSEDVRELEEILTSNVPSAGEESSGYARLMAIPEGGSSRLKMQVYGTGHRSPIRCWHKSPQCDQEGQNASRSGLSGRRRDGGGD